MKKAFVTVLLALVATACCAAHSLPPALFTPYVPVHPLDEGYFPRPKFFPRLEAAGLVQEHPIVTFPNAHDPHQYIPIGGPLVHYHQEHPAQYHQQHHQQQQQQRVFLPERPYLTFVAPRSSLVAYVPVQRGSEGPWAVPNVFIKGQGYSTNQYVAPAVMKQYLAQDPR